MVWFGGIGQWYCDGEYSGNEFLAVNLDQACVVRFCRIPSVDGSGAFTGDEVVVEVNLPEYCRFSGIVFAGDDAVALAEVVAPQFDLGSMLDFAKDKQ